MRQLSGAEITMLAGRSKVKSIAVTNFLSTMGTDYSAALGNLYLDAGLYKWNGATIDAIRKGIEMASVAPKGKKLVCTECARRFDTEQEASDHTHQLSSDVKVFIGKAEIIRVMESFNGDLYFISEQQDDEILCFARLYSMPDMAEWGWNSERYLKETYNSLFLGHGIWDVQKPNWRNLTTYNVEGLRVEGAQ